MTPVLIVTLKERVAAIEYAVSLFVHPNAACYVKVFGCEIMFDINQITREIIYQSTAFTKEINITNCALLIDTEVKCSKGDLSKLYDEVERESYSRLSDTKKFERGTKPFLLKMFNRYGISNIVYIQTIITHWPHGTNSVDHWLDQFELIGYPWIGEVLLSNLNVMLSQTLSNLLCDSIKITSSDILCVSKDPEIAGKSGEVISNLLRKRFSNATILNDPTSFFERKFDGTLHIFEDGLWTGTEVIGVFESLLGHRKATGKHEKVRSLSDPTTFSNYSVVLHFAIICDYGLKIFNKFLEYHNITNVTVTSPLKDNYLSVITEEGEEFFSSYKNDPKNLWEIGPPRNVVKPWIFKNSHIWGSEDRMITAHKILQQIGMQLFTRYIERQIISKKWNMWPYNKIEKCALGCWNMGLVFSFCHSIPKATLPVFWSKGSVEIDGRKLEWAPLFQNAE